jgi:DNA-binding PadR family transcriptional regulator
MKHRNRRKCSEVAYLSGVFIELYVLHAAVKEPVAAGQLVEVLTSRGYDINNRSMSALLRKFERRGWLRAHRTRSGTVHYFRTSANGRKALEQSKPLMYNLVAEFSDR